MATNFANDPAFLESQNKLIDYQRQLNIQKATLQGREHERRTSNLTSKEIASLPDDVHAFRAVGRMFIQESKSEAMTRLNDSIKNAKEEAASLEKSIKILETRVKEEEDNIRALIQAAASSS